MSQTQYKKVIVIGYGVVAADVLRITNEKKEQYGYDVIYIEHEPHLFSAAKQYAKSQAIENYVIEDKIELLQFFINETKKGKILTISASNNYLFPKELTNNEKMTIVNFHNALLPRYPGRNAPSWVIINREKETGITWHFVNKQIDAGKIIIQRKITIDNNIKAYELAALLMDVATRCFEEFYQDILEGKTIGKEQQPASNRKIYKSSEIPGNGIINLDDNPEYIYRLLRSVDYGKNRVFPFLVSKLNDKNIRITKYRIVETENFQKSDDRLFIPFEGKYLMLRFEYI